MNEGSGDDYASAELFEKGKDEGQFSGQNFLQEDGAEDS